MKSILVILGILATGQSFAAAKVIDYHFGNQMTESSLVVFSEGTVLRTERTCCPTKTDQVAEAPFNQTEMKNIESLILSAISGQQTKYGAGRSEFGSSVGSLVVFDGAGKATNIRSILIGDGAGGPQPVEFNSTEEARVIESLVFARVNRKMPF